MLSEDITSTVAMRLFHSLIPTGLETEGIFRRSANASVLKQVQQQLNEGKIIFNNVSACIWGCLNISDEKAYLFRLILLGITIHKLSLFHVFIQEYKKLQYFQKVVRGRTYPQ